VESICADPDLAAAHLEDKPAKEQREDFEFFELMAQYKHVKGERDAYDAMLKEIKQQIVEASGGQDAECDIGSIGYQTRTTTNWRAALDHYWPGADITEFKTESKPAPVIRLKGEKA
jgi:hypothetical protein